MKKSDSLKKSAAVLVILLAIGLPLACTTNNTSSPTSPVVIKTNTPSGPTATFTNTPLPGSTPTATVTPVATPAFSGDYPLASAPNGLYYDFGSSTLYVAEGEIKGGGDNTEFQAFTASGTSLAANLFDANFITTGFPTPQPPAPTPTVAFNPTTIVANLPQGIAVSSGSYFAFLDSSQSGAATLWEGCRGFDVGAVPFGYTLFPAYTNGYGGAPFVSPRAVAGDSADHFYVADAGNGSIEEFPAVCPSSGPTAPGGIHRWYGYSSTDTLRDPVAIACDSNDNIWVADAGYNPSIVQAYAPGGATILGNWALSSGVKVNGLALDGNGDFFVTDTNNGGQVEEYHYGTLTPGSINSTVSLLRTWGDPHSEHEFLDYIPASIALVGNAVFPTTISAIVVGDVDNDLLQVFQGP